MSESAYPRIIALMYHRIEEPVTNPWGICVSPEHFDDQIRIVKDNFPVITTEDAIQQADTGFISETCICVTFDDGYADNYINALPVLKKHSCEATFFIASAFIGSSIPYWWDELEMICLHAKQLPSRLDLSFNDYIHSFSFETELTGKQWQQHFAWQWYEEPPTKRCYSFISLWTLLQVQPYSDIEKQMNRIRAWAGVSMRSRLPMNEHELESLCSEKLSTIGLHTHTHPNLASHESNIQTEEIVTGKESLSNRFKIVSSILAYPYGNYNETTVSVAKEAGIKGCFTTEPKPITTASDLMKLGRYQVFDWNGNEFEKQLRKWMAI